MHKLEKYIFLQAESNNQNTLHAAMIYGFLTALCIFFGLSLLLAGPLDSTETIPGSRTLALLLCSLMCF